MVEDIESHNQKTSMGNTKEIMIQELPVFRETVMIGSSSETVLQVEEVINHALNVMRKVISQKIAIMLDKEWVEEQVEKAVITVVNQVIL